MKGWHCYPEETFWKGRLTRGWPGAAQALPIHPHSSLPRPLTRLLTPRRAGLRHLTWRRAQSVFSARETPICQCRRWQTHLFLFGNLVSGHSATRRQRCITRRTAVRCHQPSLCKGCIAPMAQNSVQTWLCKRSHLQAHVCHSMLGLCFISPRSKRLHWSGAGSFPTIKRSRGGKVGCGFCSGSSSQRLCRSCTLKQS